jgi:hypothetical protein
MNDDGKRARLRDLDESIARLRAEVPPPSADATDFVDAGQNLAAREELNGLIEAMENERQQLRDELGL